MKTFSERNFICDIFLRKFCLQYFFAKILFAIFLCENFICDISLRKFYLRYFFAKILFAIFLCENFIWDISLGKFYLRYFFAQKFYLRYVTLLNKFSYWRLPELQSWPVFLHFPITMLFIAIESGFRILDIKDKFTLFFLPKSFCISRHLGDA